MQVSHKRLRLGISRCLLGDRVRFDGGHKHDPFITETWGEFFEFVPICPEVEVGMGVPRECVRLVGHPENPRMVGIASETDWTARMQKYANQRVQELAAQQLHGFILKNNSPSCGLARVAIFGDRGRPQKQGRGLFAAVLMRRIPLLPVEEETRLHRTELRENFIERVFAFARWRELLRRHPRAEDIVSFHTRHKCTLMAHHPQEYRQLGRLVATAGQIGTKQLIEEYGAVFMSIMKHIATRRKHANVLYHLLGFLKQRIEASDRAELVECIESYRRGDLPLLVPMTLLRHHFRQHPVPWVMEQTYLNPCPAEMLLRNHA